MPTIDDYVQDLKAPSQAPAAEVSCSICFEICLDAVELPCQGQHVFCRGCVQEWLEAASTCPMCREILVEYTDADDDGGEAVQSVGESGPFPTQRQLSLVISEHVTPISLKIAFCQGVHSVTERDDLVDRVQGALDIIRSKIDPSSFNITSVTEYIHGLLDVNTEVDSTILLMEEAPIEHGHYRRIRQELIEVKRMIVNASEAVD